MNIAQSILVLAAAYTGLAVFVGLAFVAFGVSRVDSSARGAGWGFRLLILPGAALLWPLILAKWIHALRAVPGEENHV